MKNIQRKTPNFQNSEASQTIKRINRLRAAFGEINPNDQEKFINLLSAEIEIIEDEAVKLWLIKFRSILQAVKSGEVRVNA